MCGIQRVRWKVRDLRGCVALFPGEALEGGGADGSSLERGHHGTLLARAST